MRVRLIIILLLAAGLAWGCEALKGQDGADAPQGSSGPEGERGIQGPTGELGIPCDGCVDLDSVEKDSVSNAKLAEGAVDGDALRTDSVGAFQLAQPAIGSTQIGPGAVTTDLIEDGAVIAGKIAAGGIIAGKIADNAIEYGDIADNVIGSDQVSPGAVNQMWVSKFNFSQICDGSSVGGWPLMPNSAKGGLYLIFFETTVNGSGNDEMFFHIDLKDFSPATYFTKTEHTLNMRSGGNWTTSIMLTWTGELAPNPNNAIEVICVDPTPGTAASYSNSVLTVIEFSTADVTYIP